MGTSNLPQTLTAAHHYPTFLPVHFALVTLTQLLL